MRRRDYWEGRDTPGLGFLGPPTPVVKVLLLANVGVFLLQTVLVLAGRSAGSGMAWSHVFDEWFALSGEGLASGKLWQVATYMFLHGGLLHLLLNMLALWIFGNDVEQHLGSRLFVRLYALGGLVGAGFWLAANAFTPSFLVGASAAVGAVLIAFATLFPERPITLLLFFVLPVTMKAKWWAWIAVALVGYSSLMDTSSGVAHLAHLGGIVVGYVFVKWLGWGEPSWPVEKLQAALRPLTRWWQRRREARQVTGEQFLAEQVDPILDKISRKGIGSLTPRERRILEQAQGVLRDRSRARPGDSSDR